MRSDHREFILVSVLVSLIGGCVKGGEDGKTETAADSATGSDTKTDSGNTDTGPGGSGTIVLGDTGKVQLTVAALSSDPAFATANAEANQVAGQPGTLAIGSPLLLDGGSGTPAAWPIFHPDSIASGAPEGFKVTITKIVLSTVPKDQANTALTDDSTGTGNGAGQAPGGPQVLLDKAEGVTLAADSGQLDLSQLLAAGEAGTPVFPVAAGTYDRVTVTFKRRAEIKGCVTGDFRSGPGTPAAVGGVHTYCTRAGHSTFDGIKPASTEFEGLTAPQWMDFDLGIQGIGPEALTGTVDRDFNLPEPVTVAKNASVDLSLVMDLNRMLRFYNQGRVDQGPVPGMPVDRSYFFTTVFDASVFVFVGKPGRIYGYEGVAKACKFDRWSAGSGLCAPQVGEPEESAVGFWLTVITAPDGALMLGSFMPDDDNTLTVIKGSTREATKAVTAGTGTGLVNLHYGLENELGRIRELPADLEGTAVGAEVNGASFEAHMTGDCGTCDYQGVVRFKRRL